MQTIRRFHTNYHVPDGTSDADAVRRRLDGLARERLPAVIATGLDVEGDEDDEILIIRRLHLKLWLDALSLEEPEVAERWGRLLVQAVAEAILHGSSDNVVRFENRAHFVASYLADLLAGFSPHRWAYEALRPLEGLRIGQSAAYLLAERPALLPEVAERLERRGRLGPLLAALDGGDLALIWDRGLGFRDVDSRRLPEDVADLLTRLSTGLGLEAGTTTAFLRNRLRVYLLLAVAARRPGPDESLGIVAHGAARLYQLIAARPAPALWRALADGEIDGPAALAGFVASLDVALRPAGAWLIEELSSPGGSGRVAALARALRPERPSGGAETPASRRGEAAPLVRATASAGLALLLPALREAGLFEVVGREGIYQLLLDAVPPPYRPLAWGDPGPALLAGLDPEDTTYARQADVDWPAATDGEADGRDEPEYLPTTRAVLRRFARGLRGFERSSSGYLGRQFLFVPGEVAIDERSVSVTLEQAPLGIVLQMAGRTGEQGAIPWLEDRMLIVNLPGA